MRHHRRAIVASIVIALVLISPIPVAVGAGPTHVGSTRCAECHPAEADAWRGSHHDLAMAEATEQTVLGDFSGAQVKAHKITSRFYRKDGGFFVRTDGPDGKLGDYRIRYTFGWYPLQQYLIEFPRGRLQALGLAWDSRSKEDGGQRWFHLYPNEEMDYQHPLHWTSRDQTWNYQCAECHSTNLKKRYDVASDSYATIFDEINVACEACHGPGSIHVAWAQLAEGNPDRNSDSGKGLTVNLANGDGARWIIDPGSGKPRRSSQRASNAEVQVCARCHSRRGQISEDYEYGKPLSNTHRLSLLDEQLYFPDGQIKDEVYVHGSFIQSRMYQKWVSCSNCHEPHSLKLRAEDNALCTGCHLPARYDVKQHHRHEPASPGSACVTCHMPQRNYMVIDERADHSIRVPRPDLSLKLGTPNACHGCHSDKTNEWAANTVAAWYPDSIHRGPHFGEALHAAASGQPGAADRLLTLAADNKQPGIARATAVDRLRSHAQPQHLFTIERLLEDEDALVRAAAIRFFEVVDLRTRVDKGWPALSDPDRVVRLEAARVLAPLLRQRLPDAYRRELSRGVEAYAQSQWVNAERPESQLNLGLIAEASGDAQQAELAYRTALKLDPKFAPGFVNLADLYRRRGKDAEGEQILRSGIDTIPGNADLRHALGLLLVRNKQLDASLPYLRQAAELAGDNPRYAYVYALALKKTGNVAQALEVLKKADARRAGNRDILVELVNTYREQGNQQQAREFASELVRRFPHDKQARALKREVFDRE